MYIYNENLRNMYFPKKHGYLFENATSSANTYYENSVTLSLKWENDFKMRVWVSGGQSPKIYHAVGPEARRTVRTQAAESYRP